MTSSLVSPSPYKFNTPSGHALLISIVSKRVPYIPHAYQLDGVSRLLDGTDLVAVLATGSGKTGFYLFYIIALLELSVDPSLCQPPYKPIPKDPYIVIVYPTNGPEEEQAIVFEKAGVKALVINAGSLEQERKGGIDLWTVARNDVAVFNLACARLELMRYTLLYSRGQGLWQSFRQLGHSRARFRRKSRFIGTTATLLGGHPEETIFSFLGLRYGEFSSDATGGRGISYVILHDEVHRKDNDRDYRNIHYGDGISLARDYLNAETRTLVLKGG